MDLGAVLPILSAFTLFVKFRVGTSSNVAECCILKRSLVLTGQPCCFNDTKTDIVITNFVKVPSGIVQ